MLTQVPQPTQNLVISHGCFEIAAEGFTKIFNKHAKLLSCLLKLFFDDIHVTELCHCSLLKLLDVSILVVCILDFKTSYFLSKMQLSHKIYKVHVPHPNMSKTKMNVSLTR